MRQRLSYLAYQMQERGEAEISEKDALGAVAEYLGQRERLAEDAAGDLAQDFLLRAHEYSGLLAEVGPERYAFLHKNFMEYLAATWYVNRNLGVQVVMEHLDDPADWWNPIFLMCGAHKNLSEVYRCDLINGLLDRAESEGNGQRCLLLAGRLARDMGEYLPGVEHKRVEEMLMTAAVNIQFDPPQRADAADILDKLGYQPEDIYRFLPVLVGEKTVYIGQYPVTNRQYARFLQAEDFADKELWLDFPQYDENNKPMKESWKDEGWKWLQEALKEEESKRIEPRSWRDPRFGISRPSAPVVRVTWYEANAYCRWLLRHWAELDDGKANPGLKPTLARLPLEGEWIAAAGGL